MLCHHVRSWFVRFQPPGNGLDNHAHHETCKQHGIVSGKLPLVFGRLECREQEFSQTLLSREDVRLSNALAYPGTEQQEQIALLVGRLQQRADDERDRLLTGSPGKNGQKLITNGLQPFLCEGCKELRFITKMEIKRAHRHIGKLGNLGNRGILVAATRKHLACRCKEISTHTRSPPCHTALFWSVR